MDAGYSGQGEGRLEEGCDMVRRVVVGMRLWIPLLSPSL